GHHGADLGLVGAARAGDGGLDLTGGVQGDGQTAAGGAQQGDGTGLGRAHDRAHVVLAEDALHGDELRPVLVQPLLQALFEGDQAPAQVGVGGRPHDPDAAPGQPRVHPQYAHAPPSLAVVRPCRLSAATDNPGQGNGPTGSRPVGPWCLPPAACRLPPAACRLPPAASVPRRPGGGYASTFSMISSLTSKLAKTFCTSSLSSSASISLKIFFAPSSSSSTCMVGTKLASADS